MELTKLIKDKDFILLVGDFNSIRKIEEKRGMILERVVVSAIQKFNELIPMIGIMFRVKRKEVYGRIL